MAGAVVGRDRRRPRRSPVRLLASPYPSGAPAAAHVLLALLWGTPALLGTLLPCLRRAHLDQFVLQGGLR